MVGYDLPPTPGWDRVNISENLGKAAALPALPLITPLENKQGCIHGQPLDSGNNSDFYSFYDS